MRFGDILRELLEENDVSQKQLAKDLNLAASTLGNYIRNLREPDYDTLKRIAAYFGVSTDYLLNVQGGETESHGEDRLLHLYRALDKHGQGFYVEQGELLVKYQRRTGNKA